ncbi:uncharacterized protein L3040_001143 [Drepanopeziza brunnea f. sp. 'multigermtubi']|uniref:uncharacterized protein n=1 Tax=Drepanopeziza brunnea f. sp. 'multigermtubi' TaxID=698441 RepID=UPI00238B26BF|nr:hypothetical protein L3040_001143 [Drepanopeziza brunnea f. sp. 'multigermtubi']
MYNPQQYSPSPGPGHGPGQGQGLPQSSFPGPLPNNNGMAQMTAGGGQQLPGYQTPYSGSPYGGNIPSSATPNLPPNFMPPSSGGPAFQMNLMNMNSQLQAQRMPPHPPSSTPTQPGPRASPFPGPPHNTPPNAGPPSQFSTPQAPNSVHIQQQNASQQAQAQAGQAQAGQVVTPLTPKFPSGAQVANGVGGNVTPLSPGSEAREKDRVSLLLEINSSLLLEVIHLQQAHAEATKKDGPPTTNSPDGAENEKSEQEKERAEKEKAEKARPSSREYAECMRRLQSNLAYLAAIADRSHKPSSQIPAHPTIMTAPALSLKSPPRATSSSPKADTKKDEPGEKPEDEGNRGERLREQYRQLQALFPGVDPKKEPQMQPVNPALRAQTQQHAAAHLQKQQQGQGQPHDPNAQQMLQNDLLRQKMMQHQAQQQMAQNM